MTLEEKFIQMRLFRIEKEYAQTVPFDVSALEQNRHRLGSLYYATSAPPESIRAIQDWVIHNTRLGVPLSVHGESLHGFMHKNGTVFPQAIGLGADRVLFSIGCCIADGTDEQRNEAVAAAEQADAVIVVLGDNSNWYDKVAWGNIEPNGTIAVTCGETFDNHSLELPSKQQQLLEALYTTGFT